jgi:BirA family biotin operon repressor/biotin-[acetyl-CoA-carboxylase] ligase
MSISMGILDTLQQEYIEAQVKWPNDIVVSGRKIAGILIENSMQGNSLSSSIVGVGLNVNQTRFTFTGGNPTSMKRELGHGVDRENLLGDTLRNLSDWVNTLYRKDWRTIRERYLENLFRYGQWADYADAQGIFRGRINDVLEGGELCIEKEHGGICHYGFREIEYRA